MLKGKRILLVIAGSIAAYKTLDLIRRLREQGVAISAILTKGGAEFVTALSVGSLTGEKVYSELFSLTDEAEMGHIRLSRQAELVVVAPASADLMARMAAGMADDLATATLLATDKPVLIAPAMNVMMWRNAATAANLALLKSRGILTVGPNSGEMADGESGPGRMAEPAEILAAVESFFTASGVLKGRRALVTSGPTHEAIDPVRYIANHSSGKQGHAIAAALRRLGAETTLVTGPSMEPDPPGVSVVRITSASEMLAACEAALPAEIAVCAAAVADWRVADPPTAKIKKAAGAPPPRLELVENPDILATLATPGKRRPALVVGFAAETGDVVRLATDKRRRKGCDWIVANDVSPGTGTFGGDRNRVHLISESGAEAWPLLGKAEVARRLAERIAQHFSPVSKHEAAQ
ncbi:MAG: bifunctional phosphopantothenoylcysteine decarboxylase/phosphopantothenate--cysteine ligase CoaBC [Proteobacteria bacterium]|nr:bifunctional phosphopantothenoylcysteine decarboxylase/phosphopantothenate--cysteine ligase CoaBC [Pseudomonadota bacterium]MBI3499002.1 bifunctional phosphopantothenoylcysteine decarboxylase/phosphopantothenate--cysteine ligase CoaBC [Pseudomonadota bacterium]